MGLAVILVIISVSTFKTSVILYALVSQRLLVNLYLMYVYILSMIYIVCIKLSVRPDTSLTSHYLIIHPPIKNNPYSFIFIKNMFFSNDPTCHR
jgi:hypothetical protein